MENIKAQLQMLYKAHAPDKIDLIDSLLEKYKGKEKQFYMSEKAKYTKKNSITDSKKILEAAMARIAAQKKTKATTPKPEAKKPKIYETEPDKKNTDKEEKEKVIAKKEPIKKEIGSVKQAPKQPVIEASPQKDIKKTPLKKTPSIPLIHNEKAEKIVPLDKKEDKTPIIKEIPAKKEVLKKEDVTVQKDKKELDKLQEAKARLAESKKQAKSKKKKSFLWIIIAMVVVLLLILISFLYINYFNTAKDTIAETTQTEETTVIPELENIISEEITTDVAEKDITEGNVDTNHQNPIVDKPKKQINEVVVYSTADRLYAKDIPRPSVFVSCFAVKTEAAAQKKIAVLKKYKLKVHYYWIPDIDNAGNSFFKVVVGPFNNVKSAYPSLTTVQERINFDAYILMIK